MSRWSIMQIPHRLFSSSKMFSYLETSLLQIIPNIKRWKGVDIYIVLLHITWQARLYASFIKLWRMITVFCSIIRRLNSDFFIGRKPKNWEKSFVNILQLSMTARSIRSELRWNVLLILFQLEDYERCYFFVSSFNKNWKCNIK